MKPLYSCSLYAFVDTAYLKGRAPGELARQLCNGGADLIQLRAKDRTSDEIKRMAESLLPITESAGVWLVVNDHLDVARAVGAPACHLGQEDFLGAGWGEMGQLPGVVAGGEGARTIAIGLSTHSPVQGRCAVAVGADYVGIGPVFPTATKPTATAVTLDYVRWAAAHVRIPWFAIGGITLENVDEVLAAGARRICVVSAILAGPDPAGACQAFRRRIASASS